jgi:cereblon
MVEDSNNFRKRPRSDSTTKRESPFVELAILELNGVVLFPGSTIPVKLRDRSLIQYLGRQIDLCRNVPHIQPEVRLGILTYELPERRRSSASQRTIRDQRLRSSWMRRRVEGRTVSLHDEFPLDDEEDGNVNGNDNDNGNDDTPEEPKHPFVGRIGTIATIKSTHERTEDQPMNSLSSNQIWRRHEEGTELVFTAVGTSRFRVLSFVQQDPNLADYKVFKVEELKDEPLALPPIQRPLASPPFLVQEQRTDDPIRNPKSRQNQLAWNLSMLTPTPYFVYQIFWPWKLVDNLVAALKENDGQANLPCLGEIDREVLEPMRFSFWMASNMPFTERERLELLKMHSTYERLRVIYRRVKELSVRESNICCSSCKAKFTRVKSVFTVGGAEGATSNYVNEGGYIHQITTLREVDTRKLYFQGPPSTQNRYVKLTSISFDDTCFCLLIFFISANSYFPGYSWTITYCRRCASLLGWKFQSVNRRGNNESDDRPNTFFGFMSSSVSTK